MEAGSPQPLTCFALPQHIPCVPKGCISSGCTVKHHGARCKLCWLLHSSDTWRRGLLGMLPLTRVAEGLQGVQVVLRSGLVLPELAEGVCQVPKALPLRPPVPRSACNSSPGVHFCTTPPTERGCDAVPCSAAARRCGARAAAKCCSALRAAPRFCSTAASSLHPGALRHAASARSKLSAASGKMCSWE